MKFKLMRIFSMIISDQRIQIAEFKENEICTDIELHGSES